jgi:REP-associated tyrosine transposase
MARALRIQYPGAVYHVMSRGDRREPIFHEDEDRLLLLKTLGEACEKTASLNALNAYQAKVTIICDQK